MRTIGDKRRKRRNVEKRENDGEREQRKIGKGEERSKKSEGLMEGGIVRGAE